MGWGPGGADSARLSGKLAREMSSVRRLGRHFWMGLMVLLLWVSAHPVLAETGVSATDPDKRLTSQLRRAFAQVEGLGKVTLEVRGGVVVLRGVVTSSEAKTRAAELAGRLDGVLIVDNGITIETEVAERLSPVMAKLRQKAESFLAFLPMLAVAVVIFAVFYLLAGVLAARETVFRRLSRNVFVADLVRQGVRLVVILVGLLIALEILEATALVGAVLGTAGILGVALGFAFRDMAENSLASVMLSLRQPFSPNDHVAIDGHEGRVVRLTSRSTILLTLDGNHLRLPNSLVFKAVILNYTRNPERRFSFTLGVDPDCDLLRAQQLVLETLRRAPGVLPQPEPACFIQQLGDWTVDLSVSGWCDQTQSSFAKVRGEAIRLVKEALEEDGIELPGPHSTVQLQRPQKIRGEKRATQEDRTLDLKPEHSIDELVESERRSSERDLLALEAPQE